jgi:hypothetical protein
MVGIDKFASPKPKLPKSPFYGRLKLLMLGSNGRIRVTGKFDGSGVSESTGRGRSQALESKVRFADHPGVTDEMSVSSD